MNNILPKVVLVGMEGLSTALALPVNMPLSLVKGGAPVNKPM